MKISGPTFAKNKGFGYSILTTAAGTDNCGGLALLVGKNGLCMVKEAKPWGPTVISWEMQVGKWKEERWYCVGCYLPRPTRKGQRNGF